MMDSDESNQLKNIKIKIIERCQETPILPNIHSGSLDERLRSDQLRDGLRARCSRAVRQVFDEITKTRRRVVETVMETVGVVAQRAGRRADRCAALWIVRWWRRTL